MRVIYELVLENITVSLDVTWSHVVEKMKIFQKP